ncbi:MAG: hypothetical protein ACOX5Z_10320 [Desulfobulbus sp.]
MLTVQGIAIKEQLYNMVLEYELPESVLSNELSFLEKEEEALLKLSARVKAIEKDEDLSPAGRKKAIDAEIESQLERLSKHESRVTAFDDFLKDVDAKIINSVFREKGFAKSRSELETVVYELRLQEIRRLLLDQQKEALEGHRVKLKSRGQLLSDQEKLPPKFIFDMAMQAARSFDEDTERHSAMLAAIEKSPVALITPDEQKQVDEALAESAASELTYNKKVAKVRKKATELILSKLRSISESPGSVSEIQPWNKPLLSDQERAQIVAGIEPEPIQEFSGLEEEVSDEEAKTEEV